MKIDAPQRELLQSSSNKWIFSDNVRKSGKMESPGAWGQSLWNICQSFGENFVKFSSQDWLSRKNWDGCFVGAFKGALITSAICGGPFFQSSASRRKDEQVDYWTHQPLLGGFSSNIDGNADEEMDEKRAAI